MGGKRDRRTEAAADRWQKREVEKPDMVAPQATREADNDGWSTGGGVRAEAAGAMNIMVVSDDDLPEMDTCEICGAKAAFDQMTGCGDGCWMCQDCATKAAEAFASCTHEWSPMISEEGEPAQFCGKCSHIVLDESFPAVFGHPAPTP